MDVHATLHPTDLSDPKVQARLTDDKIVEQIVNGNEEKKMPSFKEKLTPDEVQAVAKFVRTLKAS